MNFGIFTPARSKVEKFRRGRIRQSDEDFVNECGLANDPAARDIALAVRRAVANVGLIDSQFIRVDDKYPGTLDVLPLWDSMDWVAFELELEEETGHKITDVGGILLGIYESSKVVTVSELVTAVCSVLLDKKSD
jgi:hypothetical protein